MIAGFNVSIVVFSQLAPMLKSAANSAKSVPSQPLDRAT